jgi:hypothetical protein
MQVVLITPPTTAACEVSLVNRMFQAGLPCLHLRKPAADTAALRAYLQDIQPQYLDRIVLHQHHSLARELPLKVSGSDAGLVELLLHRPPACWARLAGRLALRDSPAMPHGTAEL